MYNLPRHNKEEIQNMNRPVVRSKIKSVTTITTKFPTNKSPGPAGVTDKFYQTFKEELMPMLLKLSQKLKRREHYQTHFTREVSLTYQIIRKQNYRLISLMNTDAKPLSNIIAN